MTLWILAVMMLTVIQCWLVLGCRSKEPPNLNRDLANLNVKTWVALTLTFVALMPWVRAGAVAYSADSRWVLLGAYLIEAVLCLFLRKVRRLHKKRIEEAWEGSAISAALRRSGL
jgi:hypothetical protein